MTYGERLLGILELELSLYSELLTLTRAQRPLITAGDVTELSSAVSRAENTIYRIREAEVSLLRLEKEFTLETGAQGSETTLAALVSSLPDQERTACERARSQIEQVLSSIGTENAINEALLRDSLAYIENLVKLIARAEGEPHSGTIYGRLGRLDREAQGSLGISHEA
ncbi:MAG: flagellar protein FlgN [Firmicutes bacterium]|nr:flagellar protein FlgN [Bacillota bacterium]